MGTLTRSFDWKPTSSSVLEEDEGFGDWTQRKRQQMQEVGEKVDSKATGSVQAFTTSHQLQGPEQRGDAWSQEETGRRTEADEEEILCQETKEEAMTRRMEEVQRSGPEVRPQSLAFSHA